MFRFSIRDLLWLTVVVAMGVAWWVDHRSFARRTWVTFDPPYLSAALRTGEKLEIEPTPDGKITQRIVPARWPAGSRAAVPVDAATRAWREWRWPLSGRSIWRAGMMGGWT